MRIQRRDAEIAEISSASGCAGLNRSLPGGEKNGIWARFLGVEAGIENKGLDSDSQASAEKIKNRVAGRSRIHALERALFAVAVRMSLSRSASLLIGRWHPDRPIPELRASPSRH